MLGVAFSFVQSMMSWVWIRKRGEPSCSSTPPVASILIPTSLYGLTGAGTDRTSKISTTDRLSQMRGSARDE